MVGVERIEDRIDVLGRDGEAECEDALVELLARDSAVVVLWWRGSNSRG